MSSFGSNTSGSTANISPCVGSYLPASYVCELCRRAMLSEEWAALVQRVSGQTRPRISLRELFRRAGKAVQALIPCWMMSPMSVAQFLEPGGLEFDLLLMDEASQIRPEEALGAIARVAQVVIVGDQMQLPPTPFFQKLSTGGKVDLAKEINIQIIQ